MVLTQSPATKKKVFKPSFKKFGQGWVITSLAIDSTSRFAFCGRCATGKTVPALARLFRTTIYGSHPIPCNKKEGL
jgi:hypothetical protein